jgi:hypothetical protein
VFDMGKLALFGLGPPPPSFISPEDIDELASQA